MINSKNVCLIFIGFSWLVMLPFSDSLAEEKRTKLSSIFSLRNDGAIDLIKPIGSLPKEESKEEEAKPAIEKAIPLPKEEREGVIESKEKIPLRFEEKVEALPQIIPRIERKKKIEAEVMLPEESEYLFKLSPKKEALPKVTPKPGLAVKPVVQAKVGKPKVTAVKSILTPTIKPSQKEKVKKKIVSLPPAVVIPPKEDREGFSFAALSPTLKWGIILSGIATLILVIIVIYLFRQKELALPELEENMPEAERGRYKSLSRDIRDLRIGYKGIEKTVEDVEKKLGLLTPLKGVMIDEFARKTSQEVFKPVETGVKDLQNLCNSLEKMLAEFDSRLAPLDALKGLSIKELAQQTSMEFYRPLENEFKKMKASYERLIGEFEERMDRKVEGIVKKHKGLEKVISEIDGKLATIDSILSILPQREEEGGGDRSVRRFPEVNKVIEVKQKREREVLHNQIYKMSDEGLSVDEIAQRTKMGKGEVRLILGLRKR